VLHGVFGSASKVTGTIAKVGVALTFDQDYAAARERMKRRKAKHVGEGLLLGFQDFGVGLYEGVTGIITAPIEGAQKDGALGLLVGLGKGFAGAVIKPMVGAVDLVTRTAEGIKGTAQLGDIKMRIRPPRHFGPDHLMHLYNFKKAFGQDLMDTVFLNNKKKNEYHLYHTELAKGEILLATTHRLVWVGLSLIEALSGKWEIKQCASSKRIVRARAEQQGLEVTLYPLKRDDPQGETPETTLKIPLSSAPVARKVAKKISLCYQLKVEPGQQDFDNVSVSESEEDYAGKPTSKGTSARSPLLPKPEEKGCCDECTIF